MDGNLSDGFMLMQLYYSIGRDMKLCHLAVQRVLVFVYKNMQFTG
jgi:hypothetical protein